MPGSSGPRRTSIHTRIQKDTTIVQYRINIFLLYTDDIMDKDARQIVFILVLF